jgi:hypothetical protein
MMTLSLSRDRARRCALFNGRVSEISRIDLLRSFTLPSRRHDSDCTIEVVVSRSASVLPPQSGVGMHSAPPNEFVAEARSHTA